MFCGSIDRTANGRVRKWQIIAAAWLLFNGDCAETFSLNSLNHSKTRSLKLQNHAQPSGSPHLCSNSTFHSPSPFIRGNYRPFDSKRIISTSPFIIPKSNGLRPLCCGWDSIHSKFFFSFSLFPNFSLCWHFFPCSALCASFERHPFWGYLPRGGFCSATEGRWEKSFGEH